MPNNQINNPDLTQMSPGQDKPGYGKDDSKKKLPEFEQNVPHESEDEQAEEDLDLDQ